MPRGEEFLGTPFGRGLLWSLGAGVLCLVACYPERPGNLGVTNAQLSPCPATPNCVSSDSGEGARRVPPFVLAVSPDQGWPAVAEAVAALPGARVVEQTATYLHAECSSRVFGFVDDLELHLRASEGAIGVRSASRAGAWDLGANLDRVEELRGRLEQAQIIR